mgnify:CR=1 FL=1
MGVDLIFKIAAIGILISVLNLVLTRAGREEQAMLTTLSEVYESVGKPTRSGILDESTMDSLSSFQGLNNLPMTGQLDKKTWKHLALHYPLAVNLLMKAR